MHREFRILSLDGGGIRGLMTAIILDRLEQHVKQHTGQPLHEYFHLIAGTSTGSIVAAAIAKGMTSAQVIQLYRDKGARIFPYRTRLALQRLELLRRYGPSAPKYSDRGLIEVLQEEFGSTQLKQIRPNPENLPLLLITSYDTIARQAVVFKSWRDHKWYTDLPLWEVCVCSASAPTYFPAHLVEVGGPGGDRHSMIEGGVGANDPTVVAIAEAIRLLREKNKANSGIKDYSIEDAVGQIRVLSVGTGDITEPLAWEKVRGWGLAQWARRVADVFMDGPSDMYEYIARQILDADDNPENRDNYLRLQFRLDDQLLGTSLSSAIDNATPRHLEKLSAATYAYLKIVDKRLKKFVQG